MSENEYSIQRTHAGPPEQYAVLNPSGVVICHGASWRSARRIADALNTVRSYAHWVPVR